MARDYARVERAIRFICEERERLSEYHFQRLFQRWAGITPKRFLQFLTKEHAKARLRNSASVLEAALGAGLSGPGRLHDLLVDCEAVTPGEYRRAGEGLEIRYGYHATPFGECLLAATARGVCALRFIGPRSREEELRSLAAEWPRAQLVADQPGTAVLIQRVFERSSASPLPVHLKGTNFQIKVWEALLAIPEGSIVSYAGLAKAIGTPAAARAVAGAIARNPLGWIIPCHRVLRSLGEVSGYRWGPERKLAMLAWEAARGRGAPEPDAGMVKLASL
ncbi:MAG: methylated-DNA--[protein]-cysteine S-methyltransferase [Betaproteobacteria bacterium]|nr:methylated-DNA--[protein]-cysteine S-methyltransferase [Betaproteobacteria bacterium]